MNSTTMSYTRAKLVIWSHETYPRSVVREAALWMLGCMAAKQEDILQAASLL